MKKKLILLTGIVLLITILIAGGCRNSKKQNGSATVDNDTTRVHIYLKDTLINDTVHLLMHDSKKPEDVVVDSLETVVNPGDTVVFYKAHKSEVKKVKDIRQVEMVFEFFSEIVKVDSGLYVLIIDPYSPDSIRVKYEIYFTVKQDTTTWYIDPYLRIPRQ